MNVKKMTKSQESEQWQWRQRQRLQWRWWSWRIQCSPATGERRVTRAKRLFHWIGNHVNISLMFSNVYYSYLSFTKKKQDNQKKAFFLQNSQSSKLWLWSSNLAMKAAIKKSLYPFAQQLFQWGFSCFYLIFICCFYLNLSLLSFACVLNVICTTFLFLFTQQNLAQCVIAFIWQVECKLCGVACLESRPPQADISFLFFLKRSVFTCLLFLV